MTKEEILAQYNGDIATNEFSKDLLEPPKGGDAFAQAN